MCQFLFLCYHSRNSTLSLVYKPATIVAGANREHPTTGRLKSPGPGKGLNMIEVTCTCNNYIDLKNKTWHIDLEKFEAIMISPGGPRESLQSKQDGHWGDCQSGMFTSCLLN